MATGLAALSAWEFAQARCKLGDLVPRVVSWFTVGAGMMGYAESSCGCAAVA